MSAAEGAVDHADKARRLAARFPNSFHTEELIAAAQAHATLALVEQQKRVADVLENAAMGPAYGLWVKAVAS